jgi:adenosylhomocysteinase
MKYDVLDISLAEQGKKKIEWAMAQMPVLMQVRERFEKTKPLADFRVACCLHVTSETANLVITLKAGGANVALCASNPLSTQDDIASSLVKHSKIPVFAIRAESRKTYYEHIESVLSIKPNLTMDDGADLVSSIHKEPLRFGSDVVGGTEETTTGVIRLRSLEAKGQLKYPIIAVNDAKTKQLFDNRYGTGQSTIDGILRSTNRLLAGSVFVVSGYGWCGKGLAQRAKGMGAQVIVTEVDHIRALEAVMDGFRVMTLKEATGIADIFVTVTGCSGVIAKEHLLGMKDGAIISNAGHFDVEIDLASLKKLTKKIRLMRTGVDEYLLRNGKKIFVLGEGRLVNLACAEGHPANVMDLSFANQALSCEYMKNHAHSLEPKVYSVPQAIDNKIAELKLKALGVRIDKLTQKQKEYLSSWELGT